MNFTSELSAFQGALISADNVHQFSRLSAKGGNEHQINYVVDCIKTYLTQGHYINSAGVIKEKESQVKLFAMYIVLNSDLPILEQMIESEEIDTVMWTLPTISKCLMCELMWNLHMEKFIYEIISYSFPQLSVEVATIFIDNLKYFDPLECLDEIKMISSACYLALCRLHLFNCEGEKQKGLATAAYTNIQNCVKYYTEPPHNHKLARLSKYEHYKYLGRRMYSMFQLLIDCFTNFTSKIDPNFPEADFYRITFEHNCFKTDLTPVFVCDINNNVIMETFNTCNTFLLDVCKELVMEVSVDVFCCWSEIEENCKSMQQSIGELCYKVKNLLLTIPVVCEHPLLSMIELIARKPIEMQDIINATDDETILSNINKNDADSGRWIEALVHKDDVCKNIELLHVIELNLDKYSEDDCHKLYLLLNKHIDSNLENKDYVESLCLKAFQLCSMSTKYSIIDEHFNNNNFSNTKETADFNNTMTEIFNKLFASEDADLSNVLTVFIQNPQQVFTKILILASENIHQANIMLRVIKLLEKYANYYYSNETEPCIVKVIQEIIDNHLETEAKQNTFVKFISGLKEMNILSGSKLLLLVIMTNLHKSLITKDIHRTNLQIKLLKEAYKLEELVEYRAPMLAMLAQVLDMVRWKINTFTSLAPIVTESTIELQKLLFRTYGQIIPVKEKSWLKSKLVNTLPLNLYYYISLWGPPGNYLQTVTGKTIDRRLNTQELISVISQMIPSSTQSEWCSIWDSLLIIDDKSILKVFHDALAIIIMAEKSNRTSQSWMCLMYCLRNFVYIIRYKYLKDFLTNEIVKTVTYNVASLAELFDLANMEEFGTTMMPLFAYLSEKRNEFTIDLTEYLKNTRISPIITSIFSSE